MSAMQRLTCLAGPHTWERPAQAGRPPKTCPDHRLYGEPTFTPKPKATVTEIKTLPENRPTTALDLTPKGMEHYALPLVRIFLEAGLHVYCYGPSGSGKTEGAKMLAGMMFGDRERAYVKSCHALMNAEDIDGFMGPHKYVMGIAYEWLSNPDGGILLIDEMDAANPALLVAMNDILAIDIGKTYRFPNGERFVRTAAHVIMGAGNTNGLGATSNYVGRSALDRATLSRFAFVDWNYDEALEMAIVTGVAPVRPNVRQSRSTLTPEEWVRRVQGIRAIAKDQDLNLLVTPRAAIKGAVMLAKGMSVEHIEEAFIFQGADIDTVRTVRNVLKVQATAAAQ